MKFDTSINAEANKAAEYFTSLLDKKCVVEVKKISPKRSLNQNAYLHLLIGAFGLHFGYDMAEAKQLYKELNGDIYIYRKKGRVFLRSSADLSKEEMAKSIDKFMRKSAEAGYELPLATDEGWLRAIENEIERSQYL